ncbi:MAG: hypothetical protein EPN88_13765 [Bacteroidetes bacterium]|nr:MAG: hypothetical protein EPN88_13765 [Bacteroidota bacterium]
MTNKQIEEMHNLSKAVDSFSQAMKDRLKEKLLEGYWGWDTGRIFPDLRLAILEDANNMNLNGNNEKGIDIANRCMMLWICERQHSIEKDKI